MLRSYFVIIEKFLKRYFKTQKGIFTFMGATFGLTFPAGAVIIEYFINERQYDFLELFVVRPLLFVVMTTPLVLGFLASLVGARDDSIQLQKREIEKANEDTSARNNEMGDILGHIGQGIMTFGKSLKINQEFSKYLETLFETTMLEGRYFPDLLFQEGRRKEKKELEEYLQLLFENVNATDDMLSDINPISDLESPFSSGPGEVRLKYLKIKFVRVQRDEKIAKIMVLITDQTRSVLSEKARLLEQEQHNEELENISAILKIPSVDLIQYLESFEKISVKIEKVFSKESFSNITTAYLTNLNRELHSLKGASRLYNFPRAVKDIHSLENIFTSDGVKELFNMSKEDRLSPDRNQLVMHYSLNVMMLLSNIKIIFNGIHLMQEKIVHQMKSDRTTRNALPKHSGEIFLPQLISIRDNMNSMIDKITPTDPADDLIEQYDDFIQRTARELSRSGRVRELMPLQIYQNLKKLSIDQVKIFQDAIIHLLQNAIYHGIESPDERKAAGKPELGQLKISLSEMEETLTIAIEDDGRGLNLTEIRSKIGIDEHNDFSMKDAIRFLFKPGFSTSAAVGEIAGRGVGLGAVKGIVQKYKGKIFVQNKPDKGMIVTLSIPLSNIQLIGAEL